MSARRINRLVIEGCAVATVDPNRSEYASGYVEGGELRTAAEAAGRSRKPVDRGSKPEVST